MRCARNFLRPPPILLDSFLYQKRHTTIVHFNYRPRRRTTIHKITKLKNFRKIIRRTVKYFKMKYFALQTPIIIIIFIIITARRSIGFQCTEKRSENSRPCP